MPDVLRRDLRGYKGGKMNNHHWEEFERTSFRHLVFGILGGIVLGLSVGFLVFSPISQFNREPIDALKAACLADPDCDPSYDDPSFELYSKPYAIVFQEKETEEDLLKCRADPNCNDILTYDDIELKGVK